MRKTLIRGRPRRIPAKKKPTGRVPGVKVGSTPKSRAASRVNAWKHGKYAQVVAPEEGYRAKLARSHPDAPEIIEAYSQAISHGNLEGVDQLAITAMSQTEMLRRKALGEVKERGALLDEALVNSEGKVVGHRVKANPVLEHVHEFNRSLGFTAQDQLVSKKSRGEGARDAAIAAALSRDARLREADKQGLPPPPEDL